MALTQGLLNSYWQRYNQRRALTGLPSSYQEQRGMLDPMMEGVAQQDIREKQLLYQNQQANRTLDMNQQAQRDAARAATVSGATNIAGLGMQGYLGYKMMTKPPSSSETASADYLKMLTAKGNAEIAGVQPGTAGVQPGAGSGGGGMLSGAGSPTPSQDPGAYAAYDQSIAEGAGQGVGTSPGAGSGGVGLTGSTIGNMGAGAAVGAGAGYLTTQTPVGRTSNQDVANLSRNLGMTNLSNEQYAAKGSMTAGGAVAGGGWGAAIGATVYDVSNLVKTGRVSNELLGIPFADKIFNTNLSSIFGW